MGAPYCVAQMLLASGEAPKKEPLKGKDEETGEAGAMSYRKI
jgi:hypothetical protein